MGGGNVTCATDCAFDTVARAMDAAEIACAARYVRRRKWRTDQGRVRRAMDRNAVVIDAFKTRFLLLAVRADERFRGRLYSP
jgi:hypothetical protein